MANAHGVRIVNTSSDKYSRFDRNINVWLYEGRDLRLRDLVDARGQLARCAGAARISRDVTLPP